MTASSLLQGIQDVICGGSIRHGDLFDLEGATAVVAAVIAQHAFVQLISDNAADGVAGGAGKDCRHESTCDAADRHTCRTCSDPDGGTRPGTSKDAGKAIGDAGQAA